MSRADIECGGDGGMMGSRPPKVLLVDDEPSVVEWLVAALEVLGYIPLSASTAGEAEAFAARTPPDLLLCDCTLPDGTGAALVGRIRQRIPGLPAILMSGYHPRDFPQGASLPEEVRFLAKPFSLDELERLLREAFGERR